MNNYRPGDYWMMCQSCGFSYRYSQMARRWDGLWVCPQDWEPRHPQDMVRGRVDRQRVPHPSPEPDDNFLDDNEITRSML